MIYDFPTPLTDSNVGGCIELLFAPVDHIQELRINAMYNFVSMFVFKPNCTYTRAYASKGSLEYYEQMKETNSGLYFLPKVTGFYPRLSPEASRLFSYMKDMYFIVAVTDSNQNSKLVGNLDNPMAFSFSQGTGKTAASRNGYHFEFSGQTTDVSPHFNVII
jgi:hypothetical protein